MDTAEYAKSVVDDALKRTTGRVWYGGFADQVKMGTTAVGVPQSAMVCLTRCSSISILLTRSRMRGQLWEPGLMRLVARYLVLLGTRLPATGYIPPRQCP